MDSKRIRFALQKDSFCWSKGLLLHTKRTHFESQKESFLKMVMISIENGYDLGVAVHASQHVVDAEICHYDSEESHNHEYVKRHRAAQCRQRLGVKCHGINHECDECPDLLGVSSPVFAPRHIGPYSTYEDADAEGSHGRI